MALGTAHCVPPLVDAGQGRAGSPGSARAGGGAAGVCLGVRGAEQSGRRGQSSPPAARPPPAPPETRSHADTQMHTPAHRAGEERAGGQGNGDKGKARAARAACPLQSISLPFHSHPPSSPYTLTHPGSWPLLEVPRLIRAAERSREWPWTPCGVGGAGAGERAVSPGWPPRAARHPLHPLTPPPSAPQPGSLRVGVLEFVVKVLAHFFEHCARDFGERRAPQLRLREPA